MIADRYWTQVDGIGNELSSDERHDAPPLALAELNSRPVPDPERVIKLEIITVVTATMATMTSFDKASAMLSALASVGTVRSTNPGPIVQQLV